MYRKINVIEFVAESYKRAAELKAAANNAIVDCDKEKSGKCLAALAGLQDGLTIAMNAMVCEENNEFTGDFSEWLMQMDVEIEDLRKLVNGIFSWCPPKEEE